MLSCQYTWAYLFKIPKKLWSTTGHAYSIIFKVDVTPVLENYSVKHALINIHKHLKILPEKGHKIDFISMQ